jgi:hypothetical protein
MVFAFSAGANVTVVHDYRNRILHRHTAHGADKPRSLREGDIAACTDCAQVSVFNSDLAIKPWPIAMPLPDDVREAVLEAQRMVRRSRD